VNRQRGAERVAGADGRHALDHPPGHGGHDPVQAWIVEQIPIGAERQHQQRAGAEADTQGSGLGERVLRRFGEVLGGEHHRIGPAEGRPQVIGHAVQRERVHRRAELEPAEPALDEQDGPSGSKCALEAREGCGAQLIGDRRDEGDVRRGQPIGKGGIHRVGRGLVQQDPPSRRLVVPVCRRRRGWLVHEPTHIGQEGEAGARLRLTACDGQEGQLGALVGGRASRVQHRPTGRGGAVGEVVDGQAANDQEPVHRSMIGTCNSSSTSSTRAPRIS
jgi:hypothetical protein